MKAAQNGTQRKRSYKPQALKERAAQLHVQGYSNRAIARRLKVKPHTIPHMLADETETLEEYRRQLRHRVPGMLRRYDKLLDSRDEQVRCRATLWGLENTQVGVKRIDEEITKHDQLYGKTDEELRFFVQHGRWPNSSGETGESKA
jgi:transposase